jgi:hypothetical protein
MSKGNYISGKSINILKYIDDSFDKKNSFDYYYNYSSDNSFNRKCTNLISNIKTSWAGFDDEIGIGAIFSGNEVVNLNGYEIKILYATGKISLRSLQDVGDARVSMIRPIDVPMQWFSRNSYKVIEEQIHFFEEVWEEYTDLFTGKTKKRTVIKDEQFTYNSDGTLYFPYLTKLISMAISSKKKKDWEVAIENMILRKDYHRNCIGTPNFKSRNKSIGNVINNDVFPFMIKEDHASRGYYAKKCSDSVFALHTSCGIKSMELPKKSLARVTRLVDFLDGVDIGNKKFFLVDDANAGDGKNKDGSIKRHVLSDMFVTGSGYVSNSFLGQIGAFRGVNKFGLKMTSTKMTLEMKEVFADNGIDVVVASSSFKSQLNGVAHILLEKELAVLVDMLEEDVNTKLNKKKVSKIIAGIEVKGWEVDMSINITALFSLWGLSSAEDNKDFDISTGDDIETDVDDDDINNEYKEISSFYRWSFRQLKRDHDFDVIGEALGFLESGRLVKRKDFCNVKMQEIVNVFFSYGKDVADKYLEQVMRGSHGTMKEAMKDSLDYLTGNASPVSIDIDELYQIGKKMQTSENKGSSKLVLPGSFDPDVIFNNNYFKSSEEAFNWFKEDVLDGFLFKGGPKKYIDPLGLEHFIPSGAVMKQFIHKESGSNRYHLSGPGQAFQNLLVAILTHVGAMRESNNRKNGSSNRTNAITFVDWRYKHTSHIARLQNDLFGKSIDNWRVEGFGNKTILPGYWLKQDEVVVLDGSVENNTKVICSKMPVLFNKAVSAFIALDSLPEHIFGKLDDRMRFALRNIVYVNVRVLLDHQNDTDGDQWRLQNLSKSTIRYRDNDEDYVCPVPLYSGHVDHVKGWTNSYHEDEYKLKMEFKPYKYYRQTEETVVDKVNHYEKENVSDAVCDAIENKAYIGIGSNDLFYMSHVLMWAVSNKHVCFEDAVKIRDTYAMSFQDDVISGVKHETKAGNISLFKIMPHKDLFLAPFEHKEPLTRDPRESRNDLLETSKLDRYIGDSSLKEPLDNLFTAWDSHCGSGRYGISPLASRKVGKVTHISLSQINPLEDVIKGLHLLTRSYLKSVVDAAPVISYVEGVVDANGNFFNKKSEAAIEKYEACVHIVGNVMNKATGVVDISSNFSLYHNKYFILGSKSNLGIGKGTMVGDMLHKWNDLTLKTKGLDQS